MCREKRAKRLEDDKTIAHDGDEFLWAVVSTCFKVFLFYPFRHTLRQTLGYEYPTFEVADVARVYIKKQKGYCFTSLIKQPSDTS